MLCIFCLVRILLLRKNPWDNKVFYLWSVKCVFVWNGKHMPSTKLLLMGGSSWGSSPVGWRSWTVGGGFSQGEGRAVGMWLAHWEAAHACRLWRPFPSPCTSVGHPKAACVRKLNSWSLWSRQIPLLLGWLVGSALLLQLLDFYTEMCPVSPKPAVAFWLALQAQPLGFFLSSLHTVKGVPWCPPELSPTVSSSW